MPRIYSLVRPIFGFRQDTGEVVTIPAGAKLKLLVLQHGEVSLCTAPWDGRNVLAFGLDIRENGSSVEPMGEK